MIVQLALAGSSLAQEPTRPGGRIRVAVAEAWTQPGSPPILRLELTSEENYLSAGSCLRVAERSGAGRWRVTILGVERCGGDLFHVLTPARAVLPLPVQDSGAVRLELSRGRDTVHYEIRVYPRYVFVRTELLTGFTIAPPHQTNRIMPHSLHVTCTTVMLDAGACRAFATVLLDTAGVRGYLVKTYYSAVPPYHHPLGPRDSLAEMSEVVLSDVDTAGMARVRRLASTFTTLMRGRHGSTWIYLRDWLGRFETCTAGGCAPSQ